MFFIFLLVLVASTCGNPSSRLKHDDEPSQDEVSVSVVFDDHSKTLQIKSGSVSPYVAQAFFKNTMNSTGWSLLKLYTNGEYDDHLQAQAAGLAEGFITAEQISMHWQNTMVDYCNNEKEFCDKILKFLSDMDEWIQSQIKENPNNPYWYQVSLIIEQRTALTKGYEQAKMQPILNDLDFLFMNSIEDIVSLEQAFGRKTLSKVKGFGSCSALVKLFDKNEDIAISHVTWTDYNMMLRIFKFYNLSFHMVPNKESPLIPGQIQSFSSYPGVIYSIDDFYILSSGLVSQETTNGNSNPALWKYITSSSVLESVRIIVANRLAVDGNSWCFFFEKFNSGTYNNQWMILDYKLFEPGKPLKPDTLWILEQLPGIVEMADMTVLLEEQRYWASYNIPYFPNIYNMSGKEAEKEKYGSYFDYHKAARAQIFKRDQSKVTDMQSLVKLMRYNNFKNDPLSKCNCTPPYSADLAISARWDLNPVNGTYPIPPLGHGRIGGLDVKATNMDLAKKFSQIVAGGPTFDQQPPFQWSKTEWKKPLGHPDVFRFEPRLLDWNMEKWDAEQY